MSLQRPQRPFRATSSRPYSSTAKTPYQRVRSAVRTQHRSPAPKPQDNNNNNTQIGRSLAVSIKYSPCTQFSVKLVRNEDKIISI